MLEANLQTLRGNTQIPLEDFPYAAVDWTPEEARLCAQREGLNLLPEHWETIRALQAYFAHNTEKNHPWP